MDYGSRYTDKREKMLALRLQKVYLEARKEIEKRLDAFLNQHMETGTEMWRKVVAGEIEIDEYNQWMKRQVFIGKKWKGEIDHLTDMLKTTNEKALSVIRGEQYNVFSENANYEAYTFEKDLRGAISFDIYDEATVERLVDKKPELLPRKTINGKKDKAWNQGVISNAVTRAIIQGESIDKLAARLARDTASTDMRAMVRYARTAMTGAQNAGRIETMHRAEDMDIFVRKAWLATLDRRTRDAHRLLDGQEQDVDKPFKSELGDIMYPGDPHASPGNIFNCRCTLTHVFPKFERAEWNGERRDQQNNEVIANMSYREWLAMKEKQRYEKTVPRPEMDVTDRYLRNAKPGKGKVTYDKILNKPADSPEIKIARFLRDTFGGDVHVKQEIDNSKGIKYSDFIWKSKNWELKSPQKLKSPDRLLEDGLRQIRKNPGGIILDYQSEEFDLERIVNGAKRRMESAGFNVDLMILHKGKFICVKRYKK